MDGVMSGGLFSDSDAMLILAIAWLLWTQNGDKTLIIALLSVLF